MAMRSALLTSLASGAAAHAGLTSPPSRVEPAWNQFSQGCFIGCDECSGTWKKPPGHCQDTESTVDPAFLEHPGTPSYESNPWHSPGTAPLFSPCGNRAGAQSGKDGRDSDGPWTEWALGSVQEIKLNVVYNHYGGYAVRLCPLNEELTEECFQRHYLPFEGDEHERTTTGTYPSGSQWTKMPTFSGKNRKGDVVDHVKVQGVGAGDYALSLRWDCEETPQIWVQCANIKIVMSDDPPDYFYQTITPSRNTNLCVDLPGGDTSLGNKLWLWECNGKASQRWRWDNWQIRYAPDESKCIDAGDKSDGFHLWLWDCNDQSQQAWGYNSETNQAVMDDGTTCLDYYGDQDRNGQDFHIWTCNGDWNQEWSIWDHSDSALAVV